MVKTMRAAGMKLLATGSAVLIACGAFASTSAQAATNVRARAHSETGTTAISGGLRFKVCGVTEGAGCEFVWRFYLKSKTWVSEQNPEVGGSFAKVGTRTYSLRYEDGANDGCEILAGKASLSAPITGGLYCEGELIEELAEAKLVF
jgi:hypothetical protein